MIVIIDNYDSFTYNIFQVVSNQTSEEVKVIRNDEISITELENLPISHLIISPGPGRPEDAGISIEAIQHFAPSIPILGVCLGHQAIGYAFGGEIVQARHIKHGVVEVMDLDGKGVFRTIGKQGTFTRYHSLAVSEKSIQGKLLVTAKSEDGEVMGIRHPVYNVEGVQFHPESIASLDGEKVIKAFLSYRMENFPFKKTLTDLLEGRSMSFETAKLFMEDLTDGELDERQTTSILIALAAKGPSAEEIAGCATVLGKKKRIVPFDGDVIDIVGTGGDGKGSFNISSLSALTVATCGLCVAKHGNRAVSSLSGAADFYESLGFNIQLSPEKTAQCLKKTSFGFFYAPIYHSAMRYAAPVRKVLGVKTIMNLVGPLSNPVGASHQLIGVYSDELLEPVASAAHMLNVRHVMVVHSRDGFDELSPFALNDIVTVTPEGILTRDVFDPSFIGLISTDSAALDGGDSTYNAQMAYNLLEGNGSEALLATVALNAGAALFVGEKVSTIKEGYEIARRNLTDGSVYKKIVEVRETTNG